ncbi:MAG: cyclic peptide export ABC transporter [Methylobacter sp.]|jgi:putative ATP-binding cassette transporter|nr:cyclic peptide export ABC transporter [Methylobacter sp.]
MLVFLCRSSWLTIIGVLLTGVISGLSSAALVALINSTLSNALDVKLLPWLFGGLSVAVLSSSFVSHYLLNGLSAKIVCDLRIQISRLILAAPYPYLQKLGKSALLANLTEDITAIANASQLLPIVCINFAVVAGCMAYLSWLSWHLALVLGGVIVFGVLSSSLFREWPKKALLKAREEYDVLSSDFRALTEGIRELKLHRQRSDAFMAQSLAASAEAYRRYSFRGAVAYLLVNQWAQLLYYLVIGVILYVFPVWQVIDQNVIRGYALVFLFMMSPLTVLTNSLPVFSRANVSLQKVRQLGDRLKQQVAQADAPVIPEACAGFFALELQGVTHSFHREKENRNFTLGPIDLDFKPGELVFLVGGNGSGKTTLAMLLMGLYMPEQGFILWNGGVVDEHNRDDYLQNFSVIFSDFYLFDELYGFDNENNHVLVADYLQRLHLHHKVRVENGRFSSVNLSQGQRKRLALLVAYLEDRPFYVFDEWAADQDPEFKHLFYTELLPALQARGKTVLVISHDDRYFYLADRCIKLEEGQIVGMDKPAAAGKQMQLHEYTVQAYS